MAEMGVTVLIVDDYAPFRSSARALFDGGRFRVVGEAGDGASALQAVVTLRPDVVLLDVHLPDLDGFEVARRLAARPHAPAVILTSSRDASDFPGRLAQTSACGFISKADLSQSRVAELLEVGS
jgi:DNA-binding NarL/FixJ family response regulator